MAAAGSSTYSRLYVGGQAVQTSAADSGWVQVDTTNILFICGGAFVGLDEQVANRTIASSMGFGNPVRCAYDFCRLFTGCMTVDANRLPGMRGGICSHLCNLASCRSPICASQLALA